MFELLALKGGVNVNEKTSGASASAIELEFTHLMFHFSLNR